MTSHGHSRSITTLNLLQNINLFRFQSAILLALHTICSLYLKPQKFEYNWIYRATWKRHQLGDLICKKRMCFCKCETTVLHIAVPSKILLFSNIFRMKTRTKCGSLGVKHSEIRSRPINILCFGRSLRSLVTANESAIKPNQHSNPQSRCPKGWSCRWWASSTICSSAQKESPSYKPDGLEQA